MDSPKSNIKTPHGGGTPLVTFRTPASSIKQLNDIAAAEGRTRSDIIRRALRREIQRVDLEGGVHRV